MRISRHAIPLVLAALLLQVGPSPASAATAPKARLSAAEPRASATAGAPALPYFRITVVDEETSRGIPAVRITTTNFAQYWTDSAGMVAFYEPDLMNQEVYFTFDSHGYSHAKDAWFAMTGQILMTKEGGSERIVMRRDNIAQRLYRMTGAGIYRDSILLGDKVPPVEEAGRIPIMGQDGADAILFKDQLYWFWGDTITPRFPIGIFRGTGAVSQLPGRGGLDPAVGVAFKYFRNPDGTFRQMIDLPQGGVYWYTALRTVRDKAGRESLVSDYSKIEKPMNVVERGMLEFSEQKGVLELVTKYSTDTTVPFDRYEGPPFRHTVAGREYFYYPSPYPGVRCPTDRESQTDFAAREAFTCLREGSRFDGSAGQLDRDTSGILHWGWKRNTSPIAETEMEKLVKANAMRPDEQWYVVRDFDTGKVVASHSGSVYWNEFRKRWVCVRAQKWGDTMIGEGVVPRGRHARGPVGLRAQDRQPQLEGPSGVVLLRCPDSRVRPRRRALDLLQGIVLLRIRQ